MSNSELYIGGEPEGIGEHARKLLMFHVKHYQSANAHADKKNANRRHTNYLICKVFQSILIHFGAIVLMTQTGAFGARRNNGLELYIGECPIPVAPPLVADHIGSAPYSPVQEVITTRARA